MAEYKVADNWVRETWEVGKSAVTSDGGLVASQHVAASEIGARVLEAGGNAVDAAVAAGIAIGCVEPWMSGLGGGGYMQVWPAGADRPQVIDFGMVSPGGLDPADYPLTGDTRSEIFTWPEVVGDRNMQGYTSMMVPGYVAGMALAMEAFGTCTWAETLAPAIDLAEAGMPVDWFATMRIASNARALSRDEEAARVFLPDGFAPGSEVVGPLPRVALGSLAKTLKRLAEAGPRDFYEGEIAGSIAADCAAGGGCLSRDDLARYEARLAEPVTGTYRGATVHGTPDLTAGPTLLDTLSRLEAIELGGAAPDAAAYTGFAQSLFDAYDHRLSSMGASIPESPDPGCTTHLTVIDGDGTMVALTQTLLSVFGSKAMLPDTGILMNNGIMWFDPRPGGPNSIRAGTRPLSNMCPTMAVLADGSRLALGASGGRRIMPSVLQLLSFVVDYEMDLNAAFAQPRIDVSGGERMLADPRLPESVIDALTARFPVDLATHAVFPTHYACPNGILLRAGNGRREGAAFVMSPWAQVSAARSQ